MMVLCYLLADYLNDIIKKKALLAINQPAADDLAFNVCNKGKETYQAEFASCNP